MCKRYIYIVASVLLLFSCGKSKSEGQKMATDLGYDSYLLVGTYTAQTSEGINIYKFNSETGESEYQNEVKLSNPSYLTLSADEKYVYAVSENDANTSRVTAFSFDKAQGLLDSINSQKVGDSPCFITTDKKGKNIVIAEYGGGRVVSFKVDDNGGLLGEARAYSFKGKSIDPNRQTKSYLHNVKFSPDEKFLFANDLGADKIYSFDVTEDFGLRKEETILKAGSGPRHTEFHPNGKFAYTITEISGDVIVFDYNAEEGLFTEKQMIKADTLNAQGSADIQITPDGRYLYASNRLKGDGIAIFSIDAETGMLIKLGYQETGIHPRNIAITPNGKLLLSANRDSNNIQVFRIENDGMLTDLNQNISLSMPVCLKFASLN